RQSINVDGMFRQAEADWQANAAGLSFRHHNKGAGARHITDAPDEVSHCRASCISVRGAKIAAAAVS
ncbi:hypothetical protein, partial [Escherichia coli]|uniref:hypothetical protein n=1 Tax=Escherichia coli TaxID=562 RepID=UPI003CEF29C2